MNVIFDCDNTLGVPGCDVDDGLALLYLLGKREVEICGITTTYGNSDIATVYNNTQRMLLEIGRADLHVYQGCKDRYAQESEAVDFLLETINDNPGNISILATGSLTNLYAAYLKDHTVLKKLSQIVVMGGITSPLVINGKILNELNFSCDPTAAKRVLKEGANLSILTGNNCLQAFFNYTDYRTKHAENPSSTAQYILSKCEYWFQNMLSRFSVNGFYNWDVVAAVYLTNPNLFIQDFRTISLDDKNLETGFLEEVPERGNSTLVNLPVIKDCQAFKDVIYNAWSKV